MKKVALFLLLLAVLAGCGPATPTPMPTPEPNLEAGGDGAVKVLANPPYAGTVYRVVDAEFGNVCYVTSSWGVCLKLEPKN